MRTRIITVGLLSAPWLLASGCANVTGGRGNNGAATNIRTITSVGDKTMPVVAGTPGNEVAAGQAPPERRVARSQENRISGRVFDEQGKPVPNAEVRLALGGASRGKAVRALTDESGAFTLQGLRQGTPYTVIAERTVGRDVLSGRSDVKAPRNNVRITLSADEAASPRADATSDDAPGRINRVSGRADDEGESSDGDAPINRPRINDEDLPPAAEAGDDAGEESPPEPTAARKGRGMAPAPSTGWRKGPGVSSASPDAASVEPEEPAPTLADGAGDRERETSPPPIVPSDAELRGAAEESSSPTPEILDDPERTASAPSTRPRPGPMAEAPAAMAEESSPLPDLLGDGGAANKADSSPTPPAVAGDPVSTAPEPIAPEPTPIPGAAPAPAPAAEETSAGPDDVPPTVGDMPDLAEATPEPARPQAPAAKRVTWGELTAKSGAQFTSIDKAPARPKLIPGPSASASASAPARSKARAGDGEKAACEYDSRRQQLIDFRLPDLQGKPVHFQDLGADLVLLDFWGSWCGPCIQSIPHLVELQEKYGDRLKVVGIAYEEGSTAERIAVVEAARRKLGINYQLLLGGIDGNCPIQAAFHVQAYPTMILVDKQGHILWRDQGAAVGTLARLDRVLETNAKSVVARR